MVYFHALADFNNELMDSEEWGGFYAYWSVVGWESGGWVYRFGLGLGGSRLGCEICCMRSQGRTFCRFFWREGNICSPGGNKILIF